MDIGTKLDGVLERARRTRAAVALLELEDTEKQLKAARSRLAALQAQLRSATEAGKTAAELTTIAKGVAAVVAELLALAHWP